MDPPPDAPNPFRGARGESHTSGLSQINDADVVGVCDLVPELLENFKSNWKQRWPNANTYSNYREMIDKENIDILTVATPDDKHADIAVYAAMNGVKGIFCEKPIATSIEDADKILEACEQNGVVISVDYSRRWQPIYHTIRESIRGGEIGIVKTIITIMGGERAMLFRNGSHLIDLMCFYAESDPVQVSARLEEGFEDWDRYKGDGGTLPENDPSGNGLVIFNNGIRGIYQSDKCSFLRHKLLIIGSGGEINVDLAGPTAEVVTRAKSSNQVSRTEVQTNQYHSQGFQACYEELINLVENGGAGVSSGREARKTVQIMTGFLQSNQDESRLVNL